MGSFIISKGNGFVGKWKIVNVYLVSHWLKMLVHNHKKKTVKKSHQPLSHKKFVNFKYTHSLFIKLVS